jgi:aspartyl-tRNA synthetase
MAESSTPKVPTEETAKLSVEEVPLGEDGKPLSKNALKKLAKDKEKAEKAAKREALEAEQKKQKEAAANLDKAKENYGVNPLIQSTQRSGAKRTQLADLTEKDDNTSILFSARVSNARVQSAKLGFLVFRQGLDTIQSVVAENKEGTVSRQMVKFASSITSESIVLVTGLVKKAPEPIKSATISDLEIHIQKIYVVSEAAPMLPLQLEDAMRPEGGEEDAETDESGRPVVSLKTKLDNRFIDLRTPVNDAIMTISSGVCTIFREYLLNLNFREFHTPKLLSSPSEGGANVFEVTYFEKKAYLAQSPQLSKQMLIAADKKRVFEIGPVFRAENSNTHRHMTEVSLLILSLICTILMLDTVHGS